MKIDHPSQSQIRQLLPLWKQIFGEYGGFWEVFLETAFSPENCLCMVEQDIASSLCWLDCDYSGQKIAYIYAVLTHPEHRGQGLCRTLMENAHHHLAARGYDAAMLVPAEEGLRRMYCTMGYETCTALREFSCPAGEKKEPLRAIGPEEYGRLRRKFLPEGGVIQEGAALRLLAQDAQFYVGENVLLAAYADGDTLHALELLGDSDKAPGIVAALDCQQGKFRTPGNEKAFAMFHPLKEGAQRPSYFGFAFD